MKNYHTFYEAFGEMLYLVAMADGAVQESEWAVIENRLADHPWGEDIKWSFHYEEKKRHDLEALYQKVLSYCDTHGPEKEYGFMLELLEEVANAHEGKVTAESTQIQRFVDELTQKFQDKLDLLGDEN